MARGEVRERAIRAAVIELLGELGYAGMTMDAVAARAHASKTTIHRRWPGKPQLVLAAVDGYAAERLTAGTDTGSLRGDLLAVLQAMAGHLTSEFLAMMSLSGLTAGSRRCSTTATRPAWPPATPRTPGCSPRTPS
ncbi:TetR/AcrR family transcriptional regulator [Trebonia kvetii]|uniref:TetR/AcrR family transcriptional regulator n=1 Tax=Trebonia kvetii TaxID=2480626 RepID=A0A6P2C6A2_9ACTN|nr:TetR family transcriptional regulator [Trebonia kvetii]TVZ06808.1 TetR/AcrR family transcriptional regulator [Trebonia kvetii]